MVRVVFHDNEREGKEKEMIRKRVLKTIFSYQSLPVLYHSVLVQRSLMKGLLVN
jgi:hypothetical protein